MKLTAAVLVFLLVVPAAAAFGSDLLDFGEEIAAGAVEADAMDREQPGEGGEEIAALYLGERDVVTETPEIDHRVN